MVVDLWGGTADRDAATVAAVGAGHDHQRLVDDQDRVGACLPDARRPGRARPLRAGGQGVAGVRRRGQGRHRGPPRDEPHRRPVRLAGADHVRGPLRPATRSRRCSPPRRRGGSRARRPATTPSPRATSRARSSGASPGRRSGSSSPRTSPARSAPTSTSAPRPSTTTASPTVIPPPPLPIPRDLDPESVMAKTFTNPMLDATKSWDDPVAAGRDPGRRRPRQRPLGGPDPHADGVRRRGQRRSLPRQGDHRRRVRRAVQRHRPRARRAAAPRHRLRALQPRDAAQPERADLLLGRLGRLAGDRSTSTPG